MILTEQEMVNRLDSAKNVLLIEPDYPTKYPPFALAKIKTYLTKRNTHVDFSNKILPKKYDLICITTLFTYYSAQVFSVIKNKGFFNADTPIIVGGVFASLMPEKFDIFNNVDVFTGYSKILDIQYPDEEIMSTVEEKWEGYSWVFTSRGCPNKCLAGNTVVNTVHGDIPIKDLVGKEVGVYTYSPETKKVFISTAIHIREMGVKQLVRVLFDDGTFIDCTPDHKFLTWKNGNQYVPITETTKEAKDLLKNDRMRAMKTTDHKQGYKVVNWGMRSRKLQHRLVMEYKLGRKLKDSEVVHHKKENWDNLPDDLELCSGMKEHFENHPEIAERMRNDNPQKHCTEESFKKMGDANKGIKRSKETRQKLRDSKLGKRNPNYKNGKYLGQKSRIDEGTNHKVVSVTPIGEEMTYDMEVPETSWFFANNVLVHNCAYCSVWRIEKDRWINPKWKETVDKKSKVLLLMDNNLSSVTHEHLNDVVEFVNSRKLKVQFEGGLDCKFVTKEIAEKVASMKFVRHGIRTAFDRIDEDGTFQKAIKLLCDAGISTEHMMAYILFNFDDRPQDAEYRAEECARLQVRAYPSCYRPLTSMFKKSRFVGKHWTFGLTKAFRNFWIMKGIRHGFPDTTFGEYIKTKEGRSVYSLLDSDLDTWNNNGK